MFETKALFASRNFGTTKILATRIRPYMNGPSKGYNLCNELKKKGTINEVNGQLKRHSTVNDVCGQQKG